MDLALFKQLVYHSQPACCPSFLLPSSPRGQSGYWAVLFHPGKRSPPQACVLFGVWAVRWGCELQTHHLLQFPLLAYKCHVHPNSNFRAYFFSDLLVLLKKLNGENIVVPGTWWTHWRSRVSYSPKPQSSKIRLSQPCEDGSVHSCPQSQGCPICPEDLKFGGQTLHADPEFIASLTSLIFDVEWAPMGEAEHLPINVLFNCFLFWKCAELRYHYEKMPPF